MTSLLERSSTGSATRLAIFLAGAGATHVVVPRFYDAMIPRQLPGSPRAWTYGSAVAEVGVAVAVAVPRTRRLGGLAAAALFVAVLPANVKMTLDAFGRQRPVPERAVTVARLPLQLPLIRWALNVSRSS